MGGWCISQIADSPPRQSVSSDGQHWVEQEAQHQADDHRQKEAQAAEEV